MTNADLLAALRRLADPDRHLDAALMAIHYRQERRYIGCQCDCCPNRRHMDLVWVDPQTDRWVTTADDGWAYTSSVELAIRFAERIVPGCWWHVAKGKLTEHELLHGALVMFGSEEAIGAGEHETSPAIAMLIAALMAAEALAKLTEGQRQ